MGKNLRTFLELAREMIPEDFCEIREEIDIHCEATDDGQDDHQRHGQTGPELRGLFAQEPAPRGIGEEDPEKILQNFSK